MIKNKNITPLLSWYNSIISVTTESNLTKVSIAESSLINLFPNPDSNAELTMNINKLN